MTIAVYPGSFDPVTNGHLDIVARAARLFDTVIMAVFDRPQKNLLFSTAERVALLEEATRDLPRVRIRSRIVAMSFCEPRSCIGRLSS